MYNINKKIGGPLYTTDLDELKMNANCPDSEKSGSGPGSCGGASGSNNNQEEKPASMNWLKTPDKKTTVSKKNIERPYKRFTDSELKSIDSHLKDVAKSTRFTPQEKKSAALRSKEIQKERDRRIEKVFPTKEKPEVDDTTKQTVSNLHQEKNIQEGKHPAEPSDSWKKSATKLESGVFKKGDTYRLGENAATVEKGETMAFAVVTNGEPKKEFSTQGQAHFAAETYAKTGKYPEKAKAKGGDEPKTKQVLKNIAGDMKFVPTKDLKEKDAKFPPLRNRK